MRSDRLLFFGLFTNDKEVSGAWCTIVNNVWE